MARQSNRRKEPAYVALLPRLASSTLDRMGWQRLSDEAIEKLYAALHSKFAAKPRPNEPVFPFDNEQLDEFVSNDAVDTETLRKWREYRRELDEHWQPFLMYLDMKGARADRRRLEGSALGASRRRQSASVNASARRNEVLRLTKLAASSQVSRRTLVSFIRRNWDRKRFSRVPDPKTVQRDIEQLGVALPARFRPGEGQP